MRSLEGMSAIVTGATRGIGRAIVEALAAEDCNLVCVARTAAEVEKTVDELVAGGAPAIGVVADVAREYDVKKAVAKALDEFQRIDILVNNAGIGFYAPIVQTSLADWEKIVSVNLTGAFLFAREVMNHMTGRDGRGDIVNICSGAGRNGIANMGAYCASKFGLRGLTETLEVEGRPHDVRVSIVYPGSVDTGFGGGAVTDSGWKAQPEDVAEAVIAQLKASDRAWFSEITVRPRRTPKT
jgi:NAD(P)-dependent dehydrogenase (short-subunit alcohol dehydrogenase family)